MAKEKAKEQVNEEVSSITYKQINAQFMYDYICNNAPDKKKWFKEVAFDENGKYQHIKAKKAFCEEFMPEMLPKKKEEKKASDLFKDW